jgi:GTP-binding protein
LSVPFVDEVTIEVASGSGGDGAVSFRREKYVPKGGPDGGDGGKGGDVVFILKKNLKTLAHLKQKRMFFAENGRMGMGRRKSGRCGEDVYIAVPPGTLVKDKQTGEVLKDFTADTGEWVFLSGGKGGKGNWHFATSTNQTPRYAKPGRPGEHRQLLCELNIIADIGLVGLPNAGKSTLLSVLTNAHPKIAGYPFTTKIPNLGVMTYKNSEIIIADIPGIIEGASHGLGLGLRFLKHIARTKILLYLIDISGTDVERDFITLRKELKTYAADLVRKPSLVLLTKNDIAHDPQLVRKIKHAFPDNIVLSISAANGSGIMELKDTILRLVSKEAKCE